jgi:hypothetical protein
MSTMATMHQISDTTNQRSMPARPAVTWPQAISQERATELALLVFAGALVVISLFLPYWQITLHAPQYPNGLHVQAYATHLTGDVFEVDGLNHYIGMMKLEAAAPLERAVAPFAVPLIALLAVASFWLRGIWRMLARIPIIIYPVVFVADLFGWLYYAGHSLDPYAPLSSSIKPFTPYILGTGTIGQFSTVAAFQSGALLITIAAIVVLVLSIRQRQAGNVAR